MSLQLLIVYLTNKITYLSLIIFKVSMKGIGVRLRTLLKVPKYSLQLPPKALLKRVLKYNTKQLRDFEGKQTKSSLISSTSKEMSQKKLSKSGSCQFVFVLSSLKNKQTSMSLTEGTATGNLLAGMSTKRLLTSSSAPMP